MLTFATLVFAILQDEQQPLAGKQGELATIFSTFDTRTGKRLKDYWLLGPECESFHDAFLPNDVAARYALLTPQSRHSKKPRWELAEKVFAEEATEIGPIEITGAYKQGDIKIAAVERLFPSLKLKHQGDTPYEGLRLIEGVFEARRGNWIEGGKITFEKLPSTYFTTSTLLKIESNSIIAAKYQWEGRTIDYQSTFNHSGSVSKRSIGRELILQREGVPFSAPHLNLQVDRALEISSRWLKASQRADGQFIDPPLLTDAWSYAKNYLTAISLIALLHSGTPADDLSIEQGFRFLKSRKLSQVWDIALMLQAIEYRYATRLGITFSPSDPGTQSLKLLRTSLTQDDRLWIDHYAKRLISYQGKNGGFGYTDSSNENNQTTQYALLGLRSASRLGIDIPIVVWRQGLAFFEATSFRTGKGVDLEVVFARGESMKSMAYELGWTYNTFPTNKASITPPIQTNGTRVMAALSGIAICRDELSRSKVMDPKSERVASGLLWGGLAWWARHPGLRAPQHEGCGGMAAHLAYYQWSTDHAATSLGISTLNNRNWHDEGVAHIIASQEPSGYWDGGRGTPIADTAFCILFLKKASLAFAGPALMIPEK